MSQLTWRLLQVHVLDLRDITVTQNHVLYHTLLPNILQYVTYQKKRKPFSF